MNEIIYLLNMILGIIVGFNLANIIKAIQKQTEDERSRRMKIRMDEEVAYVIETAKEVGLEVDENTVLNFGFIAEIIRRLKEQTDERH